MSERSRGGPSAGDATAPDAVDRLTTALIRALRRLGAAGEPVEASRIAADAWSAVRHGEPRAADRLNGVMHHLARLEGDASCAVEEPATHSPEAR